jgi:hypothetical protein
MPMSQFGFMRSLRESQRAECFHVPSDPMHRFGVPVLRWYGQFARARRSGRGQPCQCTRGMQHVFAPGTHSVVMTNSCRGKEKSKHTHGKTQTVKGRH